LSSDFFRGLISDDEGNQEASNDAFEVLHLIAARRLARGLLTLVDATNVRTEARKPLLGLADRYRCPAVAIVFNLPEVLCQDHNPQRPLRQVESPVVRLHHEHLRQTLAELPHEGFAHIYPLSSPEDVAAVRIELLPAGPS